MRGTRWWAVVIAGVALVAGAACSSTEQADDAADPTSTTAASRTDVEEEEAVPVDPTWVLDDEAVTLSRVVRRTAREPDAWVPASSLDPDAVRTHVVYATPSGGEVVVGQADLADPEVPFAEAAPGFGDVLLDGEDPVGIAENGTGIGPSLATTRGAQLVWMHGEDEDEMRRLAATLHPIGRDELDGMVAAARTAVIDAGEAEPLVDGLTLYSEGTSHLACVDGEEPLACAEMGIYGSLIVAPILRGDRYVVAGCVLPHVPVTEVVINDVVVPTVTAPCGQAFSQDDVGPGYTTIRLADAPGGVGAYYFDLL